MAEVTVKHKLETIVLIPSRVKSLREEFRLVNWRKGIDDVPTADRYSLGWFAQFEGSRESLLVGVEKPADLNIGDSVFIAIQKPKEIR